VGHDVSETGSISRTIQHRFATFNRLSLTLFGGRFDIDTEFPAQRRGCSLRSL
jgi:hypothetical protein